MPCDSCLLIHSVSGSAHWVLVPNRACEDDVTQLAFCSIGLGACHHSLFCTLHAEILLNGTCVWNGVLANTSLRFVAQYLPLVLSWTLKPASAFSFSLTNNNLEGWPSPGPGQTALREAEPPPVQLMMMPWFW